jgi:hypothetical protein
MGAVRPQDGISNVCGVDPMWVTGSRLIARGCVSLLCSERCHCFGKILLIFSDESRWMTTVVQYNGSHCFENILLIFFDGIALDDYTGSLARAR